MIWIFNNGKVKRASIGGQYDGEKMPGDLDGWKILSADSNEIIESTYGELCKRSATLYHTYAPAAAAIEKQTQYAIGSGLIFRSQPDYQTLGWTQERAKDWGKEFQKIIHYYFKSLNFYEKQQLVFRQALFGGDSVLFFIREGDGFDLVESSGEIIDWAKADGDTTLGVKHDKFYRRQGIFTTEGDYNAFKDTDGNRNLVMFYDKKLARQLRGYPLVYKIINLAKNDDRHTDAITQRAVIESIILATQKSTGTDFAKQTRNMAAAALRKEKGAGATFTQKIGNFFKMGPGNIYQVGEGEGMEFTDQKTPSNNFGMFKDWMINYIAMATDTPPEVILSKYSTSFTAHKGALNDFKMSFMQKRTAFTRAVAAPVIEELAKQAIFDGLIEAPGFFDSPVRRQAYLSGNFIGPVPGAINPLQEVNAKKTAVEQGFQLRSDIAAEYGNEWDNFIAERAEEERRYFEASPEKQSEAIFEQEASNENDSN